MPSYEDDLIKRARELQRLATRRRKLKRQLKETDAAIKVARKHLNAIKQASEGRRPDLVPNRLHAGAVALDVLHPELPAAPIQREPLSRFAKRFAGCTCQHGECAVHPVKGVN